MSAAERIGPSNRNGVRGFTLLEVLGAVTILGVWYFVLAALATEGLLQEGKSLRKLQAGLVADRVLAELEATTLNGAAPQIMDETREGDEVEGELYEIRTAVEPFTMDFGPPEGSRPEPDIASNINEPTPPLPTFLGHNMPGFARHIYKLTVEVSWKEGFMDHQMVFRTSFAFDMLSAAEYYESSESKAADEARDQEEASADEDPEAGEELED